ncbi:TRAP-type C4-dicarboxylate transport system, small permease component [Actinobaculum suis]|uniref:C4-dicarboxylate transport system permease n=1 Tax=Actinobaculum suis TaxID=1657 RepID=A0A1B9BDM2_9ACTO|nr:TRAP transporter small permease [Actinobaculum suis]MDY5152831.1 TRAP transporter small permease [Actinobaculum suis]OCA94842.1 C4-dicarboxylate ABC transporter permease [Actinobaculum suis]OCA95430.1 C4-dicarboxylate ABC transporter permease [Actinobaculum suis]SDE45618.1 TRAP-type C4-dicarboxylate transport system, small permease component [Actinobaculum suis]VDG77235.1 C4-dicarboxylate transport system permease [Actinobaculum suis]
MIAVAKAVNKILEVICVFIFAVLVLTTTWQVFSRLVLHSPVTWSEELAKISFVWLSFLGAAYVYGKRGHMAVEYLARKLPEKGERGVAIFTHVVALIFAVVGLIWGGWNGAMNAWTQNLTALPVNIGSVYLVMPIAGVAIALYALFYIVEIAAGNVSPYPIAEADLAEEEGREAAAAAAKSTQEGV